MKGRALVWPLEAPNLSSFVKWLSAECYGKLDKERLLHRVDTCDKFGYVMNLEIFTHINQLKIRNVYEATVSTRKKKCMRSYSC